MVVTSQLLGASEEICSAHSFNRNQWQHRGQGAQFGHVHRGTAKGDPGAREK